MNRKFVTPPCDLCSSVSVVMIYAPNGCTCLANKYQRRCYQHLMRVSDTDDFKVVEDYTVDQVFISKDKKKIAAFGVQERINANKERIKKGLPLFG